MVVVDFLFFLHRFSGVLFFFDLLDGGKVGFFVCFGCFVGFGWLGIYTEIWVKYGK